MTRNHPALRKAASNADLYADPSPPRPLRHAASTTLGRANTTAGLSHRPSPDRSRHRQTIDELRNRHSFAAPAYPNFIEDDDDFGSFRQQQQQSPPPVPPKILEAPSPTPAPILEFRDGQYRKPAPSHSWLPASLPPAPAPVRRAKENPEKYTKPFTDFMTENPTIFHAVDTVAKDLEKDGYKKLSERDAWDLKAGGKYYVDRNGTSLIAFAIGDGFVAGNGAAIVAGHIDALTAKLKPIPKLRNKSGYVQLGVAPYAGALSDTWWDRDLGIGGRVLVKEHGKIVTKLVKLDWPIAKIPTLAPHFGAAANGPFNRETQMVPIIGLDNSDFGAATANEAEAEWKATALGGEGAFAATQPERLVKAISNELGITDCMYPRTPQHLVY
jgi:aminopeptidase I